LLACLICRLPRVPARVQCWIWRLAYLKLLIAFLWARPVNLAILPAAAPPPVMQTSVEWLRWPIPSQPMRIASPPPTAAGAIPAGLLALLTLWLAGVAWTAAQAGRDWVNLRRLRADCQESLDPWLSSECVDLCNQLRLRRIPTVLLHEGAGSPLLTGVFRPAILLPRSFQSDCTRLQQRLILAHELAHIRRDDLLWAWIPLLGRCLFYFLPPVWVAEREWRQSQEMACDEQVLQLAGVSREAYGETLLQVARQPRPAFPSGLMAVRVTESYTTVRRRLLAMRHAGKTSRRTLIAASALVALVGTAVIVPWRVSAQDTEKSGKESLAKQGGEVQLDKRLIHDLNLNDEQLRQTLAIGKSGSQKILQLLTPEQRRQAAAGGGGWPEILESLNLNDAQKVRIKAIMVNQEQQMQALKDQQKQALKTGASQTPQNLEEEMKSIDEETMAQINQILTPDQEKRLAEGLSQRKVDEDPLQLTDAQKARLGALKRGFANQRETINADGSLSKEQKETRAELLKRSLELQSSQVLTPDQQKRVAELEQQQRALRKNGPFRLGNLQRVENLTPEQRSRIQAVYASVEQQFVQLLTPAQKQKFQQVLPAASDRK
jgi:beta-lactamase regulating signal transducer with metallopeptidase domain/Spy/CpxP family protein refolding chaperone